MFVFLMIICIEEVCEELLDGYVDGVNFNINIDIFWVFVVFYFGDVNLDIGGDVFDNFIIIIEGLDKDLIYFIDGKWDLKFVVGFFEIRLDKEVMIIEDDLLEFMVIVEVLGYVKMVQNIVFYDIIYQYILVNMVSFNVLFKGVSFQLGIIFVDVDGVMQDIVFLILMVVGKEEMVSVRFK